MHLGGAGSGSGVESAEAERQGAECVRVEGMCVEWLYGSYLEEKRMLMTRVAKHHPSSIASKE